MSRDYAARRAGARRALSAPQPSSALPPRFTLGTDTTAMGQLQMLRADPAKREETPPFTSFGAASLLLQEKG